SLQYRLCRHFDIALTRRPVRYRNPHGRPAVPGCAAHPADPAALYAVNHCARDLVGVAESHQDLVENDIVEDLDALATAQQLGKLRCASTAALHQFRYATPPQMLDRRIDHKAAGAARRF